MNASVDIKALEVQPDFWLDSSELIANLRSPQPRIPEYFGYDAVGSTLFEEVTKLSTYYLTATESELFNNNDSAIARAISSETIVEMGSGSAKKTKILLSACLRQRPTTYMPIDVSYEMLEHSARDLARTFPELNVHALWGRYDAAFDWLRARDRDPITLAFVGSSIGNSTPREREKFLDKIGSTLRSGDRLLVTADLDKPAQVLEECYNDPLGSTAFARFRLNRLTHLNRLFDGNFELSYFYPRARYDTQSSTVKAYLHSMEEQSVTLGRLKANLHLQAGESLLVDHAFKYRRGKLIEDMALRGLALDNQWINPEMQYGVFLFLQDGSIP